jgi:hypothetical protein
MAKRTNIKRGKVVVDGIETDAKECRLCNVMQPLDNYTKRNDMADGHINNCKSCMAKRQAEYAKKNPDIRRKAERNWREKNVDKVKEMAQRSRKKNIDGYRQRLQEWRSENPERSKEINKRYVENNPDKVRESSRKWAQQNKEKVVIYAANRRARVKSLPDTFDDDWRSILLELYQGCILTNSTDNIHWDHFIPIATGKGGTYAGNMVPLTSGLNMSKGAKNPIEFLLSSGMSCERLFDILCILAWLNDMTTDKYIEYVYECFDEKE